jgi:AraC-like DNA-binding protein
LDQDIFSLRISSETFNENERVEAFRENFGKAILRVEMEPDGPNFEADMKLFGLRGFGMASGFVSPVTNRRTARLIDNDDLVFVFMESGSGSLSVDGRTIAVTHGDAVITANDEVATFTGNTRTELTNLRFERDRLAPSLQSALPAVVGRQILQDNAALRLLKHYAAAAEAEVSSAPAQTRALIVDHLYDLAALALGANADSEAGAKRRGLRAARLHAIKTAILGNLADRNMSAATLAKLHGISQRYVQMLFEAEGTTFSEFLLAQRLKRAYRFLSDQALRELSISAIAFEVGFNDLSYFNRTFRREFGATPTDIRQAARNSG